MKTINVCVPEKLEVEIENYVKGGWFADEAELLRIALQEFILRNKVRLTEQFFKEDIKWALNIKAGRK